VPYGSVPGLALAPWRGLGDDLIAGDRGRNARPRRRNLRLRPLANRAARVAEASLLAGIRPLLVPTRLEDPQQKVGFADNHFVHVSGGGGTAEIEPNAIY